MLKIIDSLRCCNVYKSDSTLSLKNLTVYTTFLVTTFLTSYPTTLTFATFGPKSTQKATPNSIKFTSQEAKPNTTIASPSPVKKQTGSELHRSFTGDEKLDFKEQLHHQANCSTYLIHDPTRKNLEAPLLKSFKAIQHSLN